MTTIKDLTPEQRTRYNTEVKARSRARQHQQEELERQLAEVPKSKDYELPVDQKNQLEANSRSVRNIINSEVCHLGDSPIVDSVIWAVYGFENNITRKVCEPFGMLIAGYHCDALASDVIELVHRQPEILLSATFASLYRKFLKLVSQWNNKTKGEYSDPRFIRDLDHELDGTYILLEMPTAPSPSVVPAPDVVPVARIAPTVQKFVAVPAVLPYEPYLSPAARRFLDNGL